MVLSNRKKVALGLTLGLMFYSGVYFYALNSDAFLSVKQEILSSDKLISEVGKVQDVELPLFGSFKSKSVTTASKSVTYAVLKVKVIGALKSLTLVIRTKQQNGVWKIQSAEEDGRQIEL